jgi:phospholipase C
MMKAKLRGATALIAVASLVQPLVAPVALAETSPIVTVQPGEPPEVGPYIAKANSPLFTQSGWTAAEITALRNDIKYVFVIFNENRSFDHEYGTFPGANGIYSDNGVKRSAANTPGFTQTYTDLNGKTQTVTPFLLGPKQNSTFHDSTDHSHTGLATKIDVNPSTGVAAMDKFSYDEYYKYAKSGNTASQAEGLRFSQLVMSHVDCNTIPFFWRWASNFTLFDNIFATEDTPSSPNAIAMIAGQSGETQWVKHPSEAAGVSGPVSGTINGLTYSGTSTTAGVPINGDPQPWWGSEFDSTATNREPTSPKEFYGSGGTSTNVAPNLTFASLPLTMMGGWVNWFTSQDLSPSTDLADISNDIPYIASHAPSQPVQWRWYQNGYDQEPTDLGAPASHKNYVSHHNGPQYLGYIANNPTEQTNLRGEGDLFSDLKHNALPESGGVFYVRGGYYNLKYNNAAPVDGVHAVIQNPNYPDTNGLTPTEQATIFAAKSGDDDHPSYSDSQLSESMAARVINEIASKPEIWNHSAIIITYDESDGLYDHVPPRILSYGPDGLPQARGVRIPLMLISPYAKAHAISHAEGDHNAVIETINAIFGLPALSSLPDEATALTSGNTAAFNQFGPANFQQKYLGPRDTNSAITDSLLSGFDKEKVLKKTPLLPASLAMVPAADIGNYPHYAGKGCSKIGITPEDVRLKITNTIPAGFNTLPSTLPAYN